jgi:exosortase/archaeosortase
MMGLLGLSDGPLPKNLREAMPLLLWGVFAFAAGFESIVSLKEGHFSQAVVFALAAIGLTWIAIKVAQPSKGVAIKRVDAQTAPPQLVAIRESAP